MTLELFDFKEGKSRYEPTTDEHHNQLIDINTGEIIEAQYNRSDVCQVPPACVIGEAMMSLILTESIIAVNHSF